MTITEYITSKIPMDKMLHLLGGFSLVMAFGCIFNWWVGLIITEVFIIGKELLDKKMGSGFDWKDILFGEYGTVAGVALLLACFGL